MLQPSSSFPNHQLSDKTVFVLDHTEYFGISSENFIDLDFGKPRSAPAGGGVPELPPISKSLWTCAVESTVEYCRIAWDLFPNGKLIRFVVSDAHAHIVNTWSPTTQTMQHIMNAMSLVGIPQRRTPNSTNDYSVIHGLRAAAEALAEPSDQQLLQLQNAALSAASSDINRSNAASLAAQIRNGGRVICITSARDNASMKSLEDIFLTLIVQQNQLTASRMDAVPTATQPQFLNIDRCHLVIINLYPSRMETLVTDRGTVDMSTVLQAEIHSCQAADIANKLTHLILPHYDLASTTVTGIPMKEEQNASSSANYDVEIFHARRAHSVIAGAELTLPTSVKEGQRYETVTLKWCTPRGLGASDMQPCVGQHRVTPVDVTSRPSSCLINFLLNGRSVLLEMPRKTASGGKLTSHLLSAHGGEIFIHTLHVSRSCLEDPPSILEGRGGRVTDYRITDMTTLIQQHRLIPLRPTIAGIGGAGVTARPPDESLRRVRHRLHSHTPYWPLTLSTTVLYNVRQFVEPLLLAASKPTLTADEVLQCQQVVYNIVALESRHETLPLPMAGGSGGGGNRMRGARKDEQYRLLWAELETLLAAGPITAEHRLVLQCLRDCYRSRHPQPVAGKSAGVDGVSAMVIDGAGGGSDATTAGRRNILMHKATTDSPLSPPLAKLSSMSATTSTTKAKTLLEIFTAAERERTQKRLDFAGRLCTPPGQVAKLYPNLGLKDNAARSETDVK